MGEPDGTVAFTIKNPSRTDDFKLSIRLDSTLQELQALIAEGYEGSPAPSTQTVCACVRALAVTSRPQLRSLCPPT